MNIFEMYYYGQTLYYITIKVLLILTISIFFRKSERFFVVISLTGIPSKLSDISDSSKLLTISEVPKTVSRIAVSGADLLGALGNELRLVVFSLSANFLLYKF